MSRPHEVVALGKGNVTHKMEEQIEVEVYSSRFERTTLSFESGQCN